MGEEGMQDLREENRLKKAQTAVKSNDRFHEQSSDSDTTPISSLDSMASSPSTSDFMEDASSPASYSSSTASSSSSLLINDNGPLSDLSQLMAKLPLKRGLSEYYEGKSQSFTCLASANNLEDLAKKENPCNKRIKMCSKGYGGGLDLDGHFSERFCSDPKAAITSFSMKSTDNSSISGSTVSAAMARRRGTRQHHDLLLRMHA